MKAASCQIKTRGFVSWILGVTHFDTEKLQGRKSICLSSFPLIPVLTLAVEELSEGAPGVKAEDRLLVSKVRNVKSARADLRPETTRS